MSIKIRFIIAALMLVWPLTAFGQNVPNVSREQRFSATGSSGNVSLVGRNIGYHRLSWSPLDTVSTCTVKVEQSVSGTGGWSDLIAEQTCTSAGALSTSTAGYANYVRITVTALSGGGTVTASYMGWIVNAGADEEILAILEDTDNVSKVEGAVANLGTPGNPVLTSGLIQGGTTQVSYKADPCQSADKTTTAISQTADTVIIAAAASKKNYICHILVFAAAAEIVNIVEGTGTTCQTGTAAIVGSTTEANGLSLAANGGFGIGHGTAAAIIGKTANVDTCLYNSGSNRISGSVTWVQQ